MLAGILSSEGRHPSYRKKTARNIYLTKRCTHFLRILMVFSIVFQLLANWYENPAYLDAIERRLSDKSRFFAVNHCLSEKVRKTDLFLTLGLEQ